jgi:hypothetical protein
MEPGRRCLTTEEVNVFSKSNSIFLQKKIKVIELRKCPLYSHSQLLTSSQVKSLITNSAFCIVQRARELSKTENFRDFGVAEASPGLQAGWPDFMFFFLSFCSFCLLIWVFRVSFCTHEGLVPYRSSAQMSCREEAGVSSAALGILEPQIARH